jgi:hypothetical protein
MTRAAWFTYSIALLIGLGCGITLGIQMATRPALARFDLMFESSSMELKDFTRLQYRYATPDKARDASLLLTSFLEEEIRQKRPSLTPPDIEITYDLAVAYLRLAAIETTAGHAAEAERYLTKARQSEPKFKIAFQSAADPRLKKYIDRSDTAFENVLNQ